MKKFDIVKAQVLVCVATVTQRNQVLQNLYLIGRHAGETIICS